MRRKSGTLLPGDHVAAMIAREKDVAIRLQKRAIGSREIVATLSDPRTLVIRYLLPHHVHRAAQVLPMAGMQLLYGRPRRRELRFHIRQLVKRRDALQP